MEPADRLTAGDDRVLAGFLGAIGRRSRELMRQSAPALPPAPPHHMLPMHAAAAHAPPAAAAAATAHPPLSTASVRLESSPAGLPTEAAASAARAVAPAAAGSVSIGGNTACAVDTATEPPAER